MKIKHNVHGWINGEAAEGEAYLVAHGGTLTNGVLTGYGSHTATFKTINPDKVKAEQEREWRDSELLRTDRFVVIPDYPTDLLVYRAALRDYPTSDDFPNGTRPEPN